MTQQAWFIVEGLLIGLALGVAAMGTGMLIEWLTDR